MSTHLCVFCQKQTAYVPLTVMHGLSGHKYSVYYCYDCSYEYAPIGGMRHHHLYKMINNRMYRWSWEDKTEKARLWYVGKPGEPGVRPNEDMKLIKTFEKYFPQVTPENIEKKLKFMLLFL